MREIKFRAWDKDTKQMINDFSVRSDGYVQVLEGDGRSGVFMRQDFLLMQYTGLKDKNGVEIYEGDIVQQVQESRGHLYPKPQLKLIKWVEGAHATGFNITLRGTYRTQVIGNIYENPELLEANQ